MYVASRMLVMYVIRKLSYFSPSLAVLCRSHLSEYARVFTLYTYAIVQSLRNWDKGECYLRAGGP